MISISTKKEAEKAKEAIDNKGKHVPVLKVVKRVIVPTITQEVPPATAQEVAVTNDETNQLIKSLTEESASIFKQRAALSSAIYKNVNCRNSQTSIDIGSVLNKIDTLIDGFNNVKTFGLRYLRAPGVTGEMTDCRKGVKAPQQGNHGKPSPRGKSQFTMKQRGVIKMHNEEKGYRDITVATIYEFKDFKSSRWIRVRH